MKDIGVVYHLHGHSRRFQFDHLHKLVPEKRPRKHETGINDGFQERQEQISVWNILSRKTFPP